MQITVITGPTKEIALPRIGLANTLTDGVELRLDLFKKLDYKDALEMREKCQKKVIFTLRGSKGGGGFLESEDIRLRFIEELICIEPDYFDIESHTDKNFIERIAALYPKTKLILSYHNFEITPNDLDAILSKMLSPHIYAYKICTTANYITDSYRMLRFIQRTAENGLRIIGLCMGDEGVITREEGIQSGNYLNYKILHKRDRCARGLKFV